MQLYYLSLFVLILCSVAAAQVCGPLNTTFTGYPPICELSYDVAYPQGKNSTGGDELYDFFAGMANASRISRGCAEAFAAYYCNQFYPECTTVNTTSTVKPACSTTCFNVLDACDGDKDKFNSTLLPYPAPTVCSSLSNDASSCSTPPSTDLSAFYCASPEFVKFDVQTTTNVICSVNYSVVALITNTSYSQANAVWHTLEDFARYTTPDGAVNDSAANCFQAFSNFYCGLAFPQCPTDGNPKSMQPICQSACQLVITACSNFTEEFELVHTSYSGLPIPTIAYCQTLTTNSCFLPKNNDTNLAFFFSGGGVIPTPTPEPIPEPDGVIYPPGGPGKGAGLGVGVLIILLLIIGAIMLVMKKQDSR